MALYAYAVVERERAVPLPDVATVDPGQELRRVTVGGLAAVVSEVDATAFEPPELERHLADAGWLGEIADDAALLERRTPAATGLVALNAAYLVPVARRDELMACLAELQRTSGDAYVIEVSGPWPPYSFTAVDVAGTH